MDFDTNREFNFEIYIYYIKKDNLLLLKASIGEIIFK